MTERKPSGLSWESWIDRQIREAEESGAFDNLPGRGKPIPDAGQPYDEMWWVAQKLKREGLTLLPPSLQLRKDVELAHERIAAATTESHVERLVRDINARIVEVNSMTFDGPPSNVTPLDVSMVLARWREQRPSSGSSASSPSAASRDVASADAADGSDDADGAGRGREAAGGWRRLLKRGRRTGHSAHG